jgi:cell division topological specificity factor
MQSLLDYFRTSRKTNKTAAVARDRLQIILAHERGLTRGPDYLPLLQRELLDVVRKYVDISEDQIKISMDKDGDCEILELNITLPDERTG